MRAQPTCLNDDRHGGYINMTEPIKRLLIIERGDAALRVARTCKRLGIETRLLIEDDANLESLDVQACDGHVSVPSVSAFLTAAEMLSLLRTHDIDAVHPGYGQPSVTTARRVMDGGVHWLGAAPEVIEAVNDRTHIRALAAELGARWLPSGPEPSDSLAALKKAAEALGYPVTLKSRYRHPAVRARASLDADELPAAVEAMQAECATHDLAPELLVEQVLPSPRRLELPVFCIDSRHVVAFLEREVSVVDDEGNPLIWEVPSPTIWSNRQGVALRRALQDVAAALASELSCTGWARASFILDRDWNYYLDDIYLGLCERHLVTDMVAVIDSVELQIQAAYDQAPRDNSLYKEWTEMLGHAMGARLTVSADRQGPPAGAEASNAIESLRWPPAPQSRIRIEPSVAVGTPIDAMRTMAKYTTYGPVRHRALLAMDRILAGTQIRPNRSNIPVLRRVLGHMSFRAGQYDTSAWSTMGKPQAS